MDKEGSFRKKGIMGKGIFTLENHVTEKSKGGGLGGGKIPELKKVIGG